MADDLFTIDAGQLDKHFLQHPNRMWKYSNAEAEQRDDHARAEAAQSLLEAELQLAIRSNPTAFGLKDKPNVDEVKAAVTVDKKMQAAVQRTLDEKRKLDILKARTGALIEQRRAAERMVDLLTINYFSSETPGTRAAGENAGRNERTATPTPKKRRDRGDD